MDLWQSEDAGSIGDVKAEFDKLGQGHEEDGDTSSEAEQASDNEDASRLPELRLNDEEDNLAPQHTGTKKQQGSGAEALFSHDGGADDCTLTEDASERTTALKDSPTNHNEAGDNELNSSKIKEAEAEGQSEESGSNEIRHRDPPPEYGADTLILETGDAMESD
jgi:hypothetical protein